MLENNTYKDKLPITQTVADYSATLFDPNYQDLILIEEMSELTKALLKYRRYPNSHDIEMNLVEEFAHVLISLEVVRQTIGISHASIEAEANKKREKYDIPFDFGYEPKE